MTDFLDAEAQSNLIRLVVYFFVFSVVFSAFMLPFFMFTGPKIDLHATNTTYQ